MAKIYSQEELSTIREMKELKKNGGLCPKCNRRKNCPNPNKNELKFVLACVWYGSE